MPYKIVKKGYPWQGGQDRFVREFFPLAPYEKSLGLTESEKLSDLETKRLSNLEHEEDLAQSASLASSDRAEPREGILTIENLKKYRRECWERGGYLDPNIVK